MRLLAVCFSPPNGAIAEPFSVIVKNMANFSSVTVVSPVLSGLNCSKVDHILVNYDPSKPQDFFSNDGIWKISRELKERKFDAVLWFSTNIANIVMLPFVDAKRHYLWCHEPKPSGRTSKVKRVLYFLNDRILAIKSSKIIVAGNSIRDICPAEWKRKIEVCPFPALNEVHDRSYGPLDFSHGKVPEQNQKFKILFFGGIQLYKGLDILALAIRSLISSEGVGKFELEIVGAGDLTLFPELIALEKEFPQDIKIINKFVDFSEIYERVNCSDIVAFPYLSATGTTTLSIVFGLGKVVVASSLGNFSDYIANGENGYLVRGGDISSLASMILYCSQNRHELPKIGQSAKAFFDLYFNPEKVAQRLLEIMQL